MGLADELNASAEPDGSHILTIPELDHTDLNRNATNTNEFPTINGHSSLNGQGSTESKENGTQATPPVRPSYFSHQRKRSSSLPLRDVDTQTGFGSGVESRRSTVDAVSDLGSAKQPVLKLSPRRLTELTSSPGSLPIRQIPYRLKNEIETSEDGSVNGESSRKYRRREFKHRDSSGSNLSGDDSHSSRSSIKRKRQQSNRSDPPYWLSSGLKSTRRRQISRPNALKRATTSPYDVGHDTAQSERSDTQQYAFPPLATPARPTHPTTPKLAEKFDTAASARRPSLQSKLSYNIPVPPASLPTYLHLELSSERPSPLYIHRTAADEPPQETAEAKLQRLVNFVSLPPKLEQVLIFGALTCLDAWLYTITILPLRFIKASAIYARRFSDAGADEAVQLLRFVRSGLGRLWHRHRRKSISGPPDDAKAGDHKPGPTDRSRSAKTAQPESKDSSKPSAQRQRASSTIRKNHKADFLQGLLILLCTAVLSRFDASQMYHSIRGQAAVKLYVIYNALEVFDKLLSALGQDILECLFMPETIQRDKNGKSRVRRPVVLFLLALLYCIVHATALFYQVITLNVAVNSYSNALLTLLMSNQFVEIKGAVFKRIEKENLFQLTCADVVERFQLLLMLVIIAQRNIIEVGGLSISLSSSLWSGASEGAGGGSAATGSSSENGHIPFNATSSSGFSTFSILPASFTIMPSLLPFQVLGPFLVVIGSEMLVDWIKHSYITKFNAASPRIYGRFLDVLAQDYYVNAFSEQTLTRRLGLPVIPLACLFVRATLQTYHMFLATNISPPSLSASTSLTAEMEPTASPVLAQLEHIFRRALGHSSFGGGSTAASRAWSWSVDDFIALATMLAFFVVLYLLLLAFKLVLGMLLLNTARNRYRDARRRDRDRERERDDAAAGSRKLAGWGLAQVGDERRSRIYEDHTEELQSLKARDARNKERVGKSAEAVPLDRVDRYSMVAKRIW